MDITNMDISKLQKALTPRLTKYIPYEPTPKQRAFLLMNEAKEILYGGAAGGGKALALDTPILTVSGWSTMGELRVGDKVFDEEGNPTTIVATSVIQLGHKVYKVTFADGEEIIADADHLWAVEYITARRKPAILTTQEMVDFGPTRGGRNQFKIRKAAPLQYPYKDLPIDPYLLGAWLGDGTSRTGTISIDEKDKYIFDGYEYHETTNGMVFKGLYNKLKENNLLMNKHIPEEYFSASFEQRLALAQGLFDTDGNASRDRGYCSICFADEDLIRDTERLLRTLGIVVNYTSSTSTCKYKGKTVKGKKYVIKFSTALPMFRLERKLELQEREGFRGTQFYRIIKGIEEVDSVPVRCIKVDSKSSLFLAGRTLVPTHNSVAQLMAALQFVDVPGYSAILFRESYADLALPGALISMSKEWLMPFVETGELRWSEKEKTYTFPSGATLSFGYLENENDCYRYMGAEFQYIGMDEVTHILPSNYRYLFSRLRKPKSLKVPLRFRATSNPGGKYGEYYYQRFFVDGEDNGRIFIGAGLDDNPHLDADAYKEALEELDPVTRDQLLNGNWEIREKGDLFTREWFPIVPANEIPAAASRVRYWDLAATDPKKRKGKGRRREPDYTVGLKMAHHQGMYWIEDIARVQKSPHDVEKLIKTNAALDGYSTQIRMEQEPGSSGIITIDHYSRNVLPGYNFSGVLSTGSKVERAELASAAAQAGRIVVASSCRNIPALYDEVDVFPYGSNDDIVDALSGAFNHFRKATVLSVPKSISKSSGSYWGRL